MTIYCLLKDGNKAKAYLTEGFKPYSEKILKDFVPRLTKEQRTEEEGSARATMDNEEYGWLRATEFQIRRLQKERDRIAKAIEEDIARAKREFERDNPTQQGQTQTEETPTESAAKEGTPAYEWDNEWAIDPVDPKWASLNAKERKQWESAFKKSEKVDFGELFQDIISDYHVRLGQNPENRVDTPFGKGIKLSLEAGKGMMTPQSQPIAEALKASPTVGSLLDAIQNSGTKLQQKLGEWLSTVDLKGVNLIYKDEIGRDERGNRILGAYDTNKKLITIYRGGENAHAVLHEVVHSATMLRLLKAERINSYNTPLDVMTPQDRELVVAYRNLEKLYQEAVQKIPVGWYGFNSVAEFMTEALTNPRFQEALASIDSEVAPLQPSLWSRFISTIKNLLGLDAPDTSVLARVLENSAAFVSNEQYGSIRPSTVEDPGIHYMAADTIAETPNSLPGDATVASYIPTNPLLLPAIADIAQQAAGLETEEPTQLYNNQKPYAPTREQNRSELLRKIKLQVKRALNDVTTVRTMASISRGFSALIDLVSQYNQRKAFLRTIFNAHMAQAYNLTAEEGKLWSEMMLITTLRKGRMITDKFMLDFANGEHGNLVIQDSEGVWRANPKLVEAGKFTLDEFRTGIKHSVFNEVKADLTPDSRVWKAYNEAYEAMFASAAARYNAQQKNRNEISKLELDFDMRLLVAPKAQSEVRTFLDRIIPAHTRVMLTGHRIDPQRKSSVMYDGKERVIDKDSGEAKVEGSGALYEAQQVRDLVGQILRGQWTEATIKTLSEKTGLSEQELTTYAEQSKNWGIDTETAKMLQGRLHSAAVNDVKLTEAGLYLIQTVAGGYIPIRRYGKYQSQFYWKLAENTPALDGKEGKAGSRIHMRELKHEFIEALPTFISDDVKNHLEPVVSEWNSRGKDKIVTIQLKDGTEVKASLIAGEVEGVPARRASINTDYEAIESTLMALGHRMDIKAREGLVQLMARHDSNLRRGLHREGRPGMSLDVLHVISEHLQTQASMSAYKEFAPDITQIVDSGEQYRPDLWGSGKAEIDALKQKYIETRQALGDANQATIIAHRELMQTARSFFGQHKAVAAELEAEINPSDQATTKAIKLRKQANEFIKQEGPRLHEAATKYAEWWQSEGVQEDPTFWREGKSAATVVQLGASFAAAFTNLSSLAVHSFAALSSYNTTTGFGGGFGPAAAFGAITKAVKALAPIMGKTAIYGTLGRRPDASGSWRAGVYFPEETLREYRDAAHANNDKMYKGYSLAAWEFMLELSSSGVLDAQRYNEMMGQANRAQYGDAFGKISAQMMAMFSATEEANRASTALASYELFAKQAAEAGMVDGAGKLTAEGKDYTRKNSVDMVLKTQGDYSMSNRPKLFRGDIASILFMYKTFAITSVELLAAMPKQGQAVFLGMLWMLAGVQGLPFWEEMIALLDLTTQKTGVGLGITKGNAERSLRMWLHELGIDDEVITGALDTMTGINIFGRAGVNIGVPGIGLLRPGVNFEEELGKALGPAVGIIKGGYTAFGDVIKGDFSDALRTQPVTGIRHLADAYTYAKYDAAMNKRGQVVFNSPTPAQVVARVLGFYPQQLQEYNATVKLEGFTREYAKEITNGLHEDFNRAYLLHDSEGMANVRAAVREHNQLFRNTSLEIKGFDKKAMDKAKEAKNDLMQRTVKTLPKAQKAEYQSTLGRGTE